MRDGDTEDINGLRNKEFKNSSSPFSLGDIYIVRCERTSMKPVASSVSICTCVMGTPADRWIRDDRLGG